MSQAASEALMDQLRAALREPVVILELTGMLTLDLDAGSSATVRPTVRVYKPGKTARSKPEQTVPVLVGDTVLQPLSEILKVLAGVLAEEGR